MVDKGKKRVYILLFILVVLAFFLSFTIIPSTLLFILSIAVMFCLGYHYNKSSEKQVLSKKLGVYLGGIIIVFAAISLIFQIPENLCPVIYNYGSYGSGACELEALPVILFYYLIGLILCSVIAYKLTKNSNQVR